MLDGSMVLLKKNTGDVAAYSFLHKSDAINTLELGWCGAAKRKDIALIPCLFKRQIEYMKLHGYEFLQGEMDTTDPYAMEVFNCVSFRHHPAWNTYQEKRI